MCPRQRQHRPSSVVAAAGGIRAAVGGVTVVAGMTGAAAVDAVAIVVVRAGPDAELHAAELPPKSPVIWRPASGRAAKNRAAEEERKT
jgi:hypothetical protein